MASPQVECGDTLVGPPAKKQESVGFRTSNLPSASPSMAAPQVDCVDTFVAPRVKKQQSRPKKIKKKQRRRWSYFDDDKEERRRYIEQVNVSDGFDVETDYGRNLCSGIVRLDLSDMDLTACAQFVVNEHNKNENDFLKLERIVKANIELVAGANFYVTLEAKNRVGETKTYQAKVYRDGYDKCNLLLFRLAPSIPPVTK